jgi:hypothetical protein
MINYNNRVIAALSLALLATSICGMSEHRKPQRKLTGPNDRQVFSAAVVRAICASAAAEAAGRNGIKPDDGRNDLQRPHTAEPSSYIGKNEVPNNKHRKHSSQTAF